MDLSRFPRRRYTPFVTPIEPLPRFSAALAASCHAGVRSRCNRWRNGVGHNDTGTSEGRSTEQAARSLGAGWLIVDDLVDTGTTARMAALHARGVLGVGGGLTQQ